MHDKLVRQLGADHVVAVAVGGLRAKCQSDAVSDRKVQDQQIGGYHPYHFSGGMSGSRLLAPAQHHQ